MASLFKIEGLPEARINKFGHRFVDLITAFSEEKSLKMDNFPETTVVVSMMENHINMKQLFFHYGSLVKSMIYF